MTTYRRSAKFVIGPLAALVLSSTAVHAQSHPVFDAKGYQPNREYFSQVPFEHVDLMTGSLVLGFTDLVLPGNAGRELRFERTWNSKDGKWSFGIAGLAMRVIDSGEPGSYPVEIHQSTPLLLTSDGAVRSTAWTTGPASGDPASRRWVSSTQFWRYDRTARQLWMPDGSFATYGNDGQLTTFQDAFGNTVTLTWLGTTLHVVQNLGANQVRDVALSFSGGGPAPRLPDDLPSSISFQGRTWTYEREGGLPLSRAVLPAGLAWTYNYQTAPNDGTSLTQVQTPGGATLTYTYETKQYVGPDPQVQYFTRVVKTRTTGGRLPVGTWQYAYTLGGSANAVSAQMTTPDGTRITEEHATSPSVETSLDGTWGLTQRVVEEPQGNGTFKTVETETRQYRSLLVIQWSPTHTWGAPALEHKTVTRFFDTGSRAYTTDYSYGSDNFADFHQPNLVTESGEATRTTTRTYRHNFTKYIRGVLASETVSTSGGGSFTTRYEYDDDTGFRKKINKFGTVTTFMADGNGNLGTETAANGHGASYGYSWGVQSRVQRALTTVTRDINPDGTIHSETSGRATTTFEYDDIGRMTKKTPQIGNPTTIEYDDAQRTIVVKRGGSGNNSELTTETDGFGRPISTRNALGVKTLTQYDAYGRPTQVSLPFDDQGPGPVQWTLMTYDALGRLKQRTNPDTSYIQNTYGPGTITTRDENGHTTTQTFQAFGTPEDARVTAVTDDGDHTWQYTYNTVGKLRRVAGPNGITRSWEYNAKNQLVQDTQPESGTVLYTEYDDAGLLKRKIDANATTYVYTYDYNDRLETVQAGARLTAVSYEPGTDNRQKISVGDSSVSFVYDDIGRLKSRTDVIKDKTYGERLEYDNDDNLVSITYASGRVVTYAYDNEHRISSVRDVTGNRDVATSFTYHPSGAIASFVAGNGLTTQMTYDAQRHWIRSIHSGPVQLDYTDYDYVGNVREIHDARPGNNQSFTYDSLDRLATANGPYGPSSYNYDAHGNRVGANYGYNDKQRLVSLNGATLTYDNNGNLKRMPNAIFNYTPDNMLESADVIGGTTTYAYDADNWRVYKSGPDGTSYFLRGPHGELLTEFENPGTSQAKTRDYIYAGSRLLAVVVTP